MSVAFVSGFASLGSCSVFASTFCLGAFLNVFVPIRYLFIYSIESIYITLSFTDNIIIFYTLHFKVKRIPLPGVAPIVVILKVILSPDAKVVVERTPAVIDEEELKYGLLEYIVELFFVISR